MTRNNDAGRQLKTVKIVDRRQQQYNNNNTSQSASAGTTRDSVSLLDTTTAPPRQRCFLSEVGGRREKWWRGTWLERAFSAFLFLHGRGLHDLLS